MSLSWSRNSSLSSTTSNSTSTATSTATGSSTTTKRTLAFSRSHSQPSAISSLAASSTTTAHCNPTSVSNATAATVGTDKTSTARHKDSHAPSLVSPGRLRAQSSSLTSALSLRSLKSPTKRSSSASLTTSNSKNHLVPPKTECNPNRAPPQPPPPSSTLALGSCTASLILSFYDGQLDRCLDLVTMSAANNDSKFKSYAQAVDRALKSFEYTSEWADLVNALSKLNRVLTNHSKYRVIPRRFIVGQRLAQCMHPLLPSGVHLKALETYDLIFTCIGPERLLAELTIYSNGLFPLLTNAAINVRPALLDLYEKHLIPLGEQLKPALDGFLIGVLPCYEEGTDLYQRTDKLLMRVGHGVGMSYFYDSLWRCILHNSSIRLPGITFIVTHFNKKRPLAEQAHILGLCMQTVVRAICASLLDSKILVQRAILDLLLTCFPLHANLSNEMEQAMASPQQTTQGSTSGGSGSGPASLNSMKPEPSLTTTTASTTGLVGSGSKSSEPNSSPVAGIKQQPPNYLPLPSITTTTSVVATGSSIPRRHFKRSELVAIITAALTVLLRRDLSLNRRLQSWFFGSDAASSAADRGGNGNGPSNKDQPISKSASSSSMFAKSKSVTSLASTTSSATVTDGPSSSNQHQQQHKFSDPTAKINRKSKRTVYFENYARSLVLEAFKRCITNPVSAITSILPATAITNSFISFTMPLTSTTASGTAGHHHPASAGSSPSASINSLYGVQHSATSASTFQRTNSLMSSTTSHHHQRTRHVIASSFSIGHGTADSYSSTNSTFWPYRLLICILDQREIATPILETLCVDILRGLYHEFELLTNVIPPPSVIVPEPSAPSTASMPHPQPPSLSSLDPVAINAYPISDDSSSSDESEHGLIGDSLNSGSESDQESEGEDNEGDEDDDDGNQSVASSSSSLSTSIAAAVGSSSAMISSSSSEHEPDSGDESTDDGTPKQSRPKSSAAVEDSMNRSQSQQYAKSRPNTGGTTGRKPNLQHNRNLSTSSNRSNRTAISASAPTVASVDDGQPIGGDKSEVKASEESNASINPTATETEAEMSSKEPHSLDADISSEDFDGSEEDSKKVNHANLFSNLTKNVKTKSATMMRKLQRPLGGGRESSGERSSKISRGTSESRMRSVMGTLPLVKQLRHKLAKYEEKSKSKKTSKMTLVKDLHRMATSATPNLMASEANALGGSSSAPVTSNQTPVTSEPVPPPPRITILEDENCFSLPHQHYYWNPCYQQLDKFQRRELLKELDRVMHLLITNVGVDFIWSKLGHIFQTATEEAVSLKKMLRLIIKHVQRNEFEILGSVGESEESSTTSSDEDDEVDELVGLDGLDEDSIGHVSESDSDDVDYVPPEASLLENETDDTVSCSSSLSWAWSLASSLLTEFKHDYKSHYQLNLNVLRRHSANPSTSSSPVPQSSFLHRNASPYRRASAQHLGSQARRKASSSIPSTAGIQLKQKLFSGLSDRCRKCHATLPYCSPVQPVGSDSLTILEACTLVRFLLGDSRPYHLANQIQDSMQESLGGGIGGSSSLFSTSNIASSLMTNSVSASMNRCSALEPLAVDSSNYHFLIHFLNNSLKLMSHSAHAFTPVDLRASVELCLALTAKLKPAIMQTFVHRYRVALGEHLTALRIGAAQGEDGAATTSGHRRKSSLGAWWMNNGGASATSSTAPTSGSRKARSSSTASSKKHLELVKEEDEDKEPEAVPVQPEVDDPLVVEDQLDAQMRVSEINDDIKMELVVDGILNFFVVFVESILVRTDREEQPTATKAHNHSSSQLPDLPPMALKLLQFYKESLCSNQDDLYGFYTNYANNYQQQEVKPNSIGSATLNIRHQLLPVYEQLCELLIEIGTVPLLTSPAFLLKRRSPSPTQASTAQAKMNANYANLLSNFGSSLSMGQKSLTQLSNPNVRWFIYLLVLSANRLSSCSHMHLPPRFTRQESHGESVNSVKESQHSPLNPDGSACCRLRHIAYTSLGTVLDLLTISRAYLGSQQSAAASASATAGLMPGMSHLEPELLSAPTTFSDFLLSAAGNNNATPSYPDMSAVDMFPGSLAARRLNFFPLIHPDLLDHLYRETVWFKMVAIRLWSNLSGGDSPLHYGTIAMLQQLHSISADTSICEAVLCDEMTGGDHYRGLIVGGVNHNLAQMQSLLGGGPGSLYQKFHTDKVYSARTRFQLLFSIIRDIRFISERLALIVTGLASTAKIDPELESDDHSVDQYDPLASSGTLTSTSGVAAIGGSNPNSSSNDGATKSSANTGTTVIPMRTCNQKLFLTDSLDVFSSELVSNLDPTNMAEMDRILRLTCPISPVALCTTLKRHFDRPLFIMLDALAHRRNVSELAASAADWLLRCLSPFDPFGGRNLPLPTSPLLANYYLGASNAESQSPNESSSDGFLFGGFGANTDVGRLLEPLLFILLHSNTSRLSVQNVNIHRYTRHLLNPKSHHRHSMTPNSSFDRLMERMQEGLSKPNEPLPLEPSSAEPSFSAVPPLADVDDHQVDESKIYAISSTNGNVIYHVRRKPPMRSVSTNSPAAMSTPNQLDHLSTGRRSVSPSVTLMTNYGGGKSPNSLNTSKVYSELVEMSRLGELPPSIDPMLNYQSRRSTGDSTMKLVVNPFDALQNIPSEVPFVSQSQPHSRFPSSASSGEQENIIQTVVKQVVDELVSSVDNMISNSDQVDSAVSKPGTVKPVITSTPTAAASNRPTFPGMASAAAAAGSSDPSTPTTPASTSTSTQIHISHLHLHLLLYERQYDSARTIYALDTILNMIETWPNRMLYSMATSTFGDTSSVATAAATAPGGHLDGTRSAQIQALYTRHRNSILGKGFYYVPPPPEPTTTTSSSGIRQSSFKSSYHHHKKSASISSTSQEEAPRNQTSSILHNISMLELVVQICLQYLRSYYPSCPGAFSSANPKQTKTPPPPTPGATGSAGLDQLFQSLKSNQSSCIDLESVYGNQRVRLMACEILRIIFHYLSSMMDQSNASLFGSSSSSGGRFFSSGGSGSRSKSQSDSIPGWAAQLRPFAQYLHDMLLRCEVQRNVLQCLVTSVWHYQQRQNQQQHSQQQKSSTSEAEKNPKSPKSKASGSYLYPTIKTGQQVDPAANAFINEILEFNDYPARIIQKSLDEVEDRSADSFSSMAEAEENDAGFHDEFEKCLLRLLEQVMILESRVAGTTTASGASATSLAASYDANGPLFKLQRFHMDLTELRFDPNVPLAGQPLLHGAIQLALQQNHRRHIHTTWLAFVESSLPYAGRFLSRLVLCVLNQLCRNLDSAIEDIERSGASGALGNGNCGGQGSAPFTSKHVVLTLQSITMLMSHCLVERSALEPLLPFLHDMFEDNDDEVLRTFGLGIQSSRRKKRSGRYDQDGSGGADQVGPGVGNGSSNGPMQLISTIFHNLNFVPTISSGSGASAAGLGSSVTADVFGQMDAPSDSPAIVDARKSILGVLNRVLVSLFNVWCTMVSVGEDPDELCDISPWDSYSNTSGFITDDAMPSSTCAHYYTKFPRFNPANLSVNVGAWTSEQEYAAAINAKRNRFKHSSCSSGWATTAYTGWFIMGTAAQVRRAIMILLSIVTASHGAHLMSSLAQVWSDLRDNLVDGRPGTGQQPFNYLNGAIDLVIAPVSAQQRQLIRLISSLSPIFSLESLIQTIRNTMKSLPSSYSSTSPSTSTGTSPPNTFYLMEVALLEFFLAYIRTFSGNTLLKSWRSIMSLIKDCQSLNVQANVPISVIQNATGASSSTNSSSTVTINVQSLVNFHLLAILHEFLFITPLCEDRPAQKYMQDVANKLIESLITVAGSRLSHSRWTLRRNLEVLPMTGGQASTAPTNISPTEQVGTATSRGSPVAGHRSSTGSRIETMESSTGDESYEQSMAMKRSLFRSSVSVSFHERPTRTSTSGVPGLTSQDTQSDILQYGEFTMANTLFSASISSDSLFSGLFSLGFPSSSGITGSTSSGSSTDLATSSQLLFDNFFCVKALYALSEFAAPVLDVVYPSEEKEKMIPLIVSLMSYVVPYLRAHMPHNWPCFDACSRLLASLTDYQYTRKAWRRETLDLLLDNGFFQMPSECLPAWRTIVDRVMTHDKNTFREFLTRMALAQSPSNALKIFVASSTIKDQEAELKAQLVKRLAFILFCSEKDQYQRYMSEIQEKLIEIHRTSQSPLVQAQVLLAFRVIILRMSPHHLASLWPFIYTEMFQVFLNIENQLLDYIKSNDQRFVNALNSTESNKGSLSAFTEIFNSFRSGDTPTPTQSDLISTFTGDSVSTASTSVSHLDLAVGSGGGSLGGGGCVGHANGSNGNGSLKFKLLPPATSGTTKSSKSASLSSQQAEKLAAQQAAQQRFEPKIPAPQLQLFLNACKLLDLAMILPSDTLPIFQLHRWAFVGDAISFHSPSGSFDLGTLFSASASSAAMANDINATPISGRHQMEDMTDSSQPSSIVSIHSSHSASNFAYESDSTTAFDSLSLNSHISESTIGGGSHQPSSLPPTLSSSTGALPGSTSSTVPTPANRAQFPNFIPHVVFLNSILNYLSYKSPKPVTYTNSSPILTINGLESVHDLHGFFKALLARSARSSSTTMVSDPVTGNPCVSDSACLNAASTNQSKQTTPLLFKRNPKTSKLKSHGRLRGSGKRAAKRGSKVTDSVPPSQPTSTGNQQQAQPSSAPLNGNNFENCSLEELFLNIDRIIASDFLEPLSSSETA